MIARIAAVVGILLVVPVRASADFIAFELDWISSDRAAGTIGVDRVEASGLLDVTQYCARMNCEPLPLQGRAELVSGSLLAMTTANQLTTYDYAAGTLTVFAEWTTPGGTVATGNYTAHVPAFTLTVREGGSSISRSPRQPFPNRRYLRS